MIEFFLSIFVSMISVMLTSLTWPASTMVSYLVIIVCLSFIITFTWKKYTNHDHPSLEPPSLDADEDHPSPSMDADEDHPSPSMDVDKDHPSPEPPSMDVDEDQRSILALPKEYDVFISFRGEDTRNTFTSHLYEALKNAGILAFIDDAKLERGQEISKALLDAIENSRFSIVIFSENYSTSSWCLDELVHIVQCRENKKQIVLPVFYRVDPSNVRRQKGSYASAFGNHEQRYKDTVIAQWKAALTTAASLSGWHLSGNKNEAGLVTEILNHIRGKINSSSSKSTGDYHLKGLFGIEKSVADLDELLSKNNAPTVGIWGMGGVGKTTVAVVMFKKIFNEFDGHCFLRNVREEHQKLGSNKLAIQLFQSLSKEKDIDFEDLDSIKRRLYHKKLLIVLDDVDDLDDYNSVLEDRDDWLNSESKVIITSRNRQVLRNIIGDEKMIHHVDILNENEALELFHFHAFKGKSVDKSYTEISRKFVEYANGLPLALIVLGSHLFRKKRKEWQRYLNKLEHEELDHRVKKVLKISFDGLDENQKSIFLDIACFYREREENCVKQMLDACYCSSDVAIEVLLDKCLITLSISHKLEEFIYPVEHLVFEMHDLLQKMGQSIARGSPDNCLESYSRLWRREDICHVLGNNIATTTLKGVFQQHDDYNGQVIKLGPSTFEKLPSLRILHLRNTSKTHQFEFTHDFHGTFPNDLGYLLWDHYPLESLGSNFKLHNLGGLVMADSKLKKLWNETQDVYNLKYVNLEGSHELTCLPDLSKANLQMLRLSICTSLVDLPPIKFHDLRDNARNDSGVMLKYNSIMPRLINHKVYDASEYDKPLLILDWIQKFSTSLLDLNGCSNLKNLSTISGNIKFICLSSTAIEELHSSIGLLKNLLVLDLRDCKCIKNLPNSLLNLESLEYLDMFGCVSIEKFPELPKSIKGLDLSGTSIQQVDSSSFECLPCLSTLYMNSCAHLENLPTTICKLESLVALDLGKCSRLKSFPEILEPMEKIEKLCLNESGIEEMSSSIENLIGLNELLLWSCKNLKCIPTTIFKLKSLMNLDFSRCPKLKIFPEILEAMEKLQKLCCGSTFYSSIISCPSEITAIQLHKEVEQFKCRKSCSITSIKVSFRKYDSDGFDGIHFTCCECFLFYSLHIILATQYLQKYIFRVQDIPIPYKGLEACFSYSGNAVPQWFNYQSVGSSIKVNLDPSLDNNFSFLGYVICVVVDFDPCTSTSNVLDLDCECHFRRIDAKFSRFNSPRQIRKFTEDYDDHSNEDSNVENNCILDWSSDYVFILYLHEFDLCGVEALFKFDVKVDSIDGFDKIRIKHCGVHLVYNDNGKEFDRGEPLS